MRGLTVKIITPESVLYNSPCLQVDLPAFEGVIGILPEHMNLVSSLEIGLVRVIEKDKEKSIEFIISDGFVKISTDKSTECIVLVEKCVDLSNIDVTYFESQLKKAESDLGNTAAEHLRKALVNDIIFLKKCLNRV
jgi:F-type H+-transporting ATPase subunit epsilon